MIYQITEPTILAVDSLPGMLISPVLGTSSYRVESVVLPVQFLRFS